MEETNKEFDALAEEISKINDIYIANMAMALLCDKSKKLIRDTLPADKLAYTFEDPMFWDYDDETKKDINVTSFTFKLDSIIELNFDNGKTGTISLIGNENISSALMLALHYKCDVNLKEYNRQQREMENRVLELENEDIIITDPCYIFKGDDWHKSNYGSNAALFGLEKYICRNTLYGDWSCTAFNSDTNEPIGNFCADAGLVCVASVKEVLKYNPNFEKWIAEHNWCVTLIKNFTGKVRFDIHHYTYEHTDDYASSVYNPASKSYEPKKDENGNIVYIWRKGDIGEGDECRVIGEGSINFITKQTGL